MDDDIIEIPGIGGRYGDTYERPAAKVIEEVLDGIISMEQARKAYAVAVDPETLELDEAETARLRYI